MCADCKASEGCCRTLLKGLVFHVKDIPAYVLITLVCLSLTASLRTSETSYLNEAFSFYSAIRQRSYYFQVNKEDRYRTPAPFAWVLTLSSSIHFLKVYFLLGSTEPNITL